MYKNGVRKLEKEMNLETILKRLRDLRILMKKGLREDHGRLKYEIIHDEKNIIDVTEGAEQLDSVENESGT